PYMPGATRVGRNSHAKRGPPTSGGPSGGGKPPTSFAEAKPVKESHFHGIARIFHAPAARSGRPLRPPEASLEPEDGALHLRHPQRHSHHRSEPDRPDAASGA